MSQAQIRSELQKSLGSQYVLDLLVVILTEQVTRMILEDIPSWGSPPVSFCSCELTPLVRALIDGVLDLPIEYIRP